MGTTHNKNQKQLQFLIFVTVSWSERGYFEESTEAVSRAQADAEARDLIPLGRVASADEIAKVKGQRSFLLVPTAL